MIFHAVLAAPLQCYQDVFGGLPMKLSLFNILTIRDYCTTTAVCETKSVVMKFPNSCAVMAEFFFRDPTL